MTARTRSNGIDNFPTAERIRSDLKKLSAQTRAIRLYSSTGGPEMVPPIANEFGLKVNVGAWIDKNFDRNEREMQSAVELAKRNSNVNGIVVGNETIYRGEQKVDDLIKLIQRVKSQVNVPVTTGEIWNIWLEHPELASSVDFIAAHILPYWEGFSSKQAVDQALIIYQKLRDAFPGKRIVIAEFGWPSAGYNLKAAVPGPFEQAVTLRNFVSRADSIGMEYNIVEAIDQPWKFFEGGVGPYWGILNASRDAKFAWTGPVVDPSKIEIQIPSFGGAPGVPGGLNLPPPNLGAPPTIPGLAPVPGLSPPPPLRRQTCCSPSAPPPCHPTRGR